MKPRRYKPKEMGAITLLDESLHILRSSPSLLAPYLIGTMPFVLGLLFFWTDMSTGASAWEHLAGAAWGMTFLYIWMKAFQSVFTSHVMAACKGMSGKPWSIRRWLAAAYCQAALQPWGILAVPLAALVMLPFAQSLACFQNITILGDGENPRLREVLKEAWERAGHAPVQNHVIIWLASPFMLIINAAIIFILVPMLSIFSQESSQVFLYGFALLFLLPLCPLGVIVALNIGGVLALLPMLPRKLLGIETVFSISGQALMNNTFLAIVIGLSFLCLDPLLKTAYCLRLFAAQSRFSGEDLLAELSRAEQQRPQPLAQKSSLAKLTLVLAAGLVFSLAYAQNAQAASPSQPDPEAVQVSGASASGGEPKLAIDPDRLDSTLATIINLPEYAWRMPREKPPKQEGRGGMLHEFFRSIGNMLEKAWNFIAKGVGKIWPYLRDFLKKFHTETPELKKPGTDWNRNVKIAIYALLSTLLGLLVFLGWKAWRERRTNMQPLEAEPQAVPDIRAEDVDASALTRDAWRDLAEELLRKGEQRLGLRALYLSQLATLGEAHFINLARCKSNREYERELERHAATHPELVQAFKDSRTLFERVWYGLHEVTPQILQDFTNNQAKVKEHART